MKKGRRTDAAGGRIIPTVYATDENYAPYASASIESLLANAAADCRLRIYILHTGLESDTVRLLESSRREGAEVTCLDVSEALADVRERLYAPSYLSPEMYYRALIPELLPEYDRVLYLDCDTAVLGDISELYGMDMKGSSVLAAKNPMHPKMRSYVGSLGLDPDGYVNSGVLLMDTAALRREGFTEAFIRELSARTELRFPDQDLINLLLRKRIGYLPPEWNYIWHMERLGKAADAELRMLGEELAAYVEVGRRAKIMHYTGDMKPWMHDALRGAEHFRRYAEACPMKEVIAERRRASLAGEEKIRLLFADFEGGVLRLTCAHALPRGLRPRPLSYSVSGEVSVPEISFVRESVSRGIGMEERIFSLSLSVGSITERGTELSFLLEGSPVLFEYGRFFPLNGFPESYFAYSGILVYREGKRLLLEACNVKKRLHRERVYLGALLREGSKKSLKYVFLRIAYRVMRRILPRGIWLISDRPDAAGDNGEALFRYLAKNGARYGIRPYFVIGRDTPDHARLRRCGRVLKPGSIRHKALSLCADVKAVSQTDFELYDVTERRLVKDLLMKQSRVFLQHGITKDDISSSYSRYTHDFDLFITAAYPEYFSIIGNPRYGLDPDRVVLTGFPRHDALADGERERVILVCPTWRRELFAEGCADMARFVASRYFEAWHSLLMPEALPALAARHGYRVVFMPHHHTEPYLEAFRDISPEVEVRTGGSRYREMLPVGALTLTDYSSVAFEAAYLSRPVVYYRFDEREFFSSHTCTEGYFDPRRDGFGEVALTEGEVLAAVERALAADCELSAEIAGRREAFFAWCDGDNSRRVTEAILRMRRDRE